MYLLDTDIVSQLRRRDRADPALLTWIEALHPADLFISTVTVLEIELGIRLLEHRKDKQAAAHFRDWLENNIIKGFGERILPIDVPVALRAAALHVPNPRPERDCLIAATALVHRMHMATRNLKDFAAMGVELVKIDGNAD